MVDSKVMTQQRGIARVILEVFVILASDLAVRKSSFSRLIHHPLCGFHIPSLYCGEVVGVAGLVHRFFVRGIAFFRRIGYNKIRD